MSTPPPPLAPSWGSVSLWGRLCAGFAEVVNSRQVSGGGRHWDKRGQPVMGGRALPLASPAPPTQQLPPGASSSCLCEVSLEGIGRRRGRFAGWTEDGLRPPFLLQQSCPLLRLAAGSMLGWGPSPAPQAVLGEYGWRAGMAAASQEAGCLCSVSESSCLYPNPSQLGHWGAESLLSCIFP